MAGIVTVRPPRLDEIPGLMERIKANGEAIDLYQTPCWVAEEDGQVLGVLPLRLWWQMEPLLVFPEVKVTAKRRRVVHELYRAAESWIADPERNGTGVFRVFMVARKVGVRSWAVAKGWVHQYKRAPMFIRNF